MPRLVPAMAAETLPVGAHFRRARPPAHPAATHRRPNNHPPARGRQKPASMQSKNKKSPTVSERRHIARIADLPCSVCNRPSPSEVHEIRQGHWFTSVALCPDCHRSSVLGLHGQRRNWAIRKMDELDALAVTVQRIVNLLEGRHA